MKIFIQALNPCLHFTKNKFTIPKHIEEILEQTIFLNPHTKLNFSSNNPYFYSMPTKILQINLAQLRISINFFNQLLFPND